MLACLGGGCGFRSTATPAVLSCDLPTTFFVVGHGWHAGIVIKRSDLLARLPSLAQDFTNGQYLEIGWGDADFYQAPSITAGLALNAILWPSSAVLHVVVVPEAPKKYFAGSEVIEVSVPAAGYEQLLDFLADSFARANQADPARLNPSLYGDGWFYRAKGKFHAFNTCNTWVAQAVSLTGFPFGRKGAITSEDVFIGLKEGNNVLKCYEAR